MEGKIHQVTFFPDMKQVQAEHGSNLLEIAAKNGILIDGSCAGNGTCGKCKVKIKCSYSLIHTIAEKKCLTDYEMECGWHLACEVWVCEDLLIELPQTTGGSQRKEALNILPEGFLVEPIVKKQYIKLKKATLEHQTDDLTRIRIALEQENLEVCPVILPELQKAIAAKRGSITAVTYADQLLTVEPDHTENKLLGMSFDIGTTTIVGMLWDLKERKMIGARAETNPQSVFGADVISRVGYCMEEDEHTRQLQKVVLDCLANMTERLCEEYCCNTEEIYDITVVGNTTMSHIFLGINPSNLSRIPFSPVFREGILIPAKELSMRANENAKVYVLPNIAGHVGSDITGVMLATSLYELKGCTVAIDIGTNGEILVAKDGEILACSTAAGPAFEGACIQCGMRAAKGAIEKVVIGEDVVLTTIEDGDPVGICGSGIIDIVAQFLKAGLINANGNLLSRKEALEQGFSKEIAERLYGEGNQAGFILKEREGEEPIVFTQADIREVQLAKGAILGGILTLMKKLGITLENLDRILIAGAFGNYIDKESALTMGLLPAIPKERITSIGNGAGVGAAMALLSEKQRKIAEEQTRKITHVELSQDMDFQEYYIDSMIFRKA